MANIACNTRLNEFAGDETALRNKAMSAASERSREVDDILDGLRVWATRGDPNEPEVKRILETEEIGKYKAMGVDSARDVIQAWLRRTVEQVEATRDRIIEEFYRPFEGVSGKDINRLSTKEGVEAMWAVAEGKPFGAGGELGGVVGKWREAVEALQRIQRITGMADSSKPIRPPLMLSGKRIVGNKGYEGFQKFERLVREHAELPDGTDKEQAEWIISAWVQATTGLRDTKSFRIRPKSLESYHALDAEFGITSAADRGEEMKRSISGFIAGAAQHNALEMHLGKDYGRHFGHIRHHFLHHITNTREAAVIQHLASPGQGFELWLDKDLFERMRADLSSPEMETKTKAIAEALGKKRGTALRDGMLGWWNATIAAVLKNAGVKYALGEQAGHLQFQKAMLGARSKLDIPIARAFSDVGEGIVNLLHIIAKGEDLGRVAGTATTAEEGRSMLRVIASAHRAMNVTNSRMNVDGDHGSGRWSRGVAEAFRTVTLQNRFNNGAQNLLSLEIYDIAMTYVGRNFDDLAKSTDPAERLFFQNFLSGRTLHQLPGTKLRGETADLGRQAWQAFQKYDGDLHRLRENDPRSYILFQTAVHRAAHLGLGFSSIVQRQWFSPQGSQADTALKSFAKFMPFLLARTRASLGPIFAAFGNKGQKGAMNSHIYARKLETVMAGWATMAVMVYLLEYHGRKEKVTEKDYPLILAKSLAYSDAMGIAGDTLVVAAELYSKTGQVDIGQLNVETLGGLAAGVSIFERMGTGVAKGLWAGVGQASPSGSHERDLVSALRTYSPFNDLLTAPATWALGHRRRPGTNRQYDLFSPGAAVDILGPQRPEPYRRSEIKRDPVPFRDIPRAHKGFWRKVKRAWRD